ncbi:hypothetical protein [Salinicola sp. MIT1003]|uniref:hypothetical protein n=1 Tax=Salinicola sp. MIT1003 TaxID=1882734 RepID=UPI0008DD72A9|nr:hypothetical protein [Salinicola sp. MIT1003]OHZ04967.1 hypothetical protein BC443_07820 [Salinicola sp. MIT1003]
MDFKAKREQAEAAAKPHWDRSEALNFEASTLENRMRDLRGSIRGVSDAAQRKPVEDEFDTLRAQAEGLRLQARDAQAAGDRLYWPIYNLDETNPRSPKELPDDPDKLLTAYKVLLGQIEETENRLKSELTAALAHHFVTEEA